MDWLLSIEQEESLVRNLYFSYHIKGDKLHWKALNPPKGRDELSVYRYKYCPDCVVIYLGNLFAKDREYAGYTSIPYAGIKDREPLTEAHTSAYGDTKHKICLCFHADIIFDYIPKAGQPIPPEIIEIMKDIAKESFICRVS